MKTKPPWISAAIILGLVAAVFPWNCPQHYLLYPCATISMIPAMALSYWPSIRYVSFVLGPVLFFASSPSLLLGKAHISRKDFWILLVFSALEVLCLALTWRGGYRYVPGPRYTDLTVVLSVFWLAALWLVFALARRRKSYGTIFAYHFIFVLWLLMYAFPWFGEMP
ncbi:MAG: hypothetical protein ACHQJX_01060 [Candidatus Acidiferrales bacterium]